MLDEHWAPNAEVYAWAVRVMRPLQVYHRHHISGLQHILPEGRLLLVVHHTFATYDSFLLGLGITEFTGRVMRGLGDNLIFRTPYIGSLGRRMGLVPASPGAAARLLETDNFVGVAPGGMWEALRGRNERYRVRWGTRRGFVRLALETGTPIILAACRTGDDLYSVYDNPITRRIYQRWHLPLPIVRGWGPTLLPRPVPLTHHLSRPIQPPPYEPERASEQMEHLFQTCRAQMEDLLHRADPGTPVYRGPSSPVSLDRFGSGGHNN